MMYYLMPHADQLVFNAEVVSKLKEKGREFTKEQLFFPLPHKYKFFSLTMLDDVMIALVKTNKDFRKLLAADFFSKFEAVN